MCKKIDSRMGKKIDSRTAEQCYYCDTFIVNKPRFEKHLKVCSRKPGITYKFQNQHFSTSEENFRLLGDLPFTIYFDLETTCGKNLYEDPINPSKNMYPVSYCFIIAFNPSLFLNKIRVLRSFADSIEELADVFYLLDEMLEHRNLTTTRQLLACVQNVVNKKNNFSLIEMFCSELKFVIDICY